MADKFSDWYLIFYGESCIDKINPVTLAWGSKIHKNQLYYILIPIISFFLSLSFF